MKKSIIILALLPLLFFGCKKGGSTDDHKPEEKLYNLSISSSGLHQTISNIQSKSSLSKNDQSIPIEDKMNSLELLIFGLDGKLVLSKTNYLLEANGIDIPNSEKFNIKLPKGSYKIGIIAHNKSLQLGSNTAQSYHIFYTTVFDELFKRNIYDYKELYASSLIPLKVESDATVSPIKLNRINSKFELEIKDQIPSEVSYILVGNKLPNFIYPLNELEIYNFLYDGYIKFNVEALSGKTNQILTSNMFGKSVNSADGINVDILFFDKNYTLLGSKPANNVLFIPNKVTRLSGNLFDKLNNAEKTSSISVEFIKEYSEEILTVPF